MNSSVLLLVLGMVSGALIAVFAVAGGLRDLLTGIRKDLIDTVKARLEVERLRLELEKERARIIHPTTDEIETVSTTTAIHGLIRNLKEKGDRSLLK